MIDRTTIDRIYERADIVEVIGEFVALKKRGVNYLGLCPFHNERTPSFTVSPSKGIFKCFGCGKSGNTVGFLMEHEGLSYPEALKYLAKKYNIEIEEIVLSDEQQQEQSRREKLLALSTLAAKWFHDQLYQTDEGKSIGLSYLRERGFTEAIIESFGLGYSPQNRSAFCDFAIKHGFSPDLLIESGLGVDSNGKLFDRFHHRVIFPIHSLSGQVIGFGGRTFFTDKKIAKYLNSPETILYQKSKILYGIYRARKAITQNDTCLLVEGYTDVLSLAQCGIENVVASSGTALTVEQIRLIKRFTNNLIVLYDGDFAGIKASLRGIDLILAEDMNVKVCLLPDGEDPDSYSRNHSAEEVKKFIDSNQTDFISFKAKLMLSEAGNDPIKKATLLKDIVHSIAHIPSEISRSIYIQQCSRMFEISEEVFYSAVAKELRKKIVEQNKSITSQGLGTTQESVGKKTSVELIDSSVEASERDLIRFLLEYGDRAVFTSVDPKNPEIISIVTIAEFVVEELVNDDLKPTDPVWCKIFNIISDDFKKKIHLNQLYFVNHPDIEISSRVAELMAKKYPLSRFWEEYGVGRSIDEQQLAKDVQSLVNVYKWRRIIELQKSLTSQLGNPELSAEEARFIMERLQKINVLRRELLRKMNSKPPS